MVEKCARLTECDMSEYQDNNLVVYNATACDGSEKFSYPSTRKIDGPCLLDSLVEVEYDPECCSENNFCQADYMTLATGNQCAADCGVF